MKWIVGGALAVFVASAQTAAEGPSFEVASVKPVAVPNAPMRLPAVVEEQMRFQGGPGSKDPGRIDYRGVTLQMLLRRAYGLELAQIVGPDWLEIERYEVSAKLPSETNVEQLRLMLQRLLTERFQIRLHREKKVLPVYQLVVGTKGPKLQPEEEKTSVYQSEEENKAAMRELQKKTMEALQAKIRSRDHSSSFHLPRATMARFAEVLSSHVDRPVRDQTHVDGEYAFSLRWFPEDNRQSGDAPLGPSIFAALEEQLGLKLQRANEEMEMLVIDKAEKIPTSN